MVFSDQYSRCDPLHCGQGPPRAALLPPRDTRFTLGHYIIFVFYKITSNVHMRRARTWFTIFYMYEETISIVHIILKNQSCCNYFDMKLKIH
jgi:hypothetical protein